MRGLRSTVPGLVQIRHGGARQQRRSRRRRSRPAASCAMSQRARTPRRAAALMRGPTSRRAPAAGASTRGSGCGQDVRATRGRSRSISARTSASSSIREPCGISSRIAYWIGDTAGTRPSRDLAQHRRDSPASVVHGVKATKVGDSARPIAGSARRRCTKSACVWPFSSLRQHLVVERLDRAGHERAAVSRSRGSRPAWSSRCSTLIVTS